MTPQGRSHSLGGDDAVRRARRRGAATIDRHLVIGLTEREMAVATTESIPTRAGQLPLGGCPTTAWSTSARWPRVARSGIKPSGPTLSCVTGTSATAPSTIRACANCRRSAVPRGPRRSTCRHVDPTEWLFVAGSGLCVPDGPVQEILQRPRQRPGMLGRRNEDRVGRVELGPELRDGFGKQDPDRPERYGALLCFVDRARRLPDMRSTCRGRPSSCLVVTRGADGTSFEPLLAR